VLAVSGGVDSMVLLDILSKKDGVQLIVAHFDHGIRQDSFMDRNLVQKAAQKCNLPFEYGNAKLGTRSSEADARDARYEFLHSIKVKHQADAIVTAHHQDDLIETAFINILRGTGYRGLSAIISNSEVKRPLLNTPKEEVKRHALKQNITWNEDSTNENTEYLRNYVRKFVMPKLSEEDRKLIAKNATKISKNSKETNYIIATVSQKIAPNHKINRREFANLPIKIEQELAMYWLKNQGVRQYDKKMVERLVLILKTASPGTKHSVGKDIWLSVKNKTAEFSGSS
jgi:tRNA(Ile)-lysidine synthase